MAGGTVRITKYVLDADAKGYVAYEGHMAAVAHDFPHSLASYGVAAVE